jgi:hypothetical protein
MYVLLIDMYTIQTNIHKHIQIHRAIYSDSIYLGYDSGCRVIGYSSGVTLPWFTFQLSNMVAVSPCPILLATSAGVSPFYIHPHDDPERDEPCRTDNTHRQAGRQCEIGDREKASYIHTCRYIHMVACKITSTILHTILHNLQLTTAKDERQNRMPKRDIFPSTN